MSGLKNIAIWPQINWYEALPMSCWRYQDNALYIEDVKLSEVAARFGTPCYVYSKTMLENNWRLFAEAFGSPNNLICYAVKANSNLAILHLLASFNAGFDIVSLGELERVITASGDPNKIIFSGVGKKEIEIEEAIKQHIYCFNVESSEELSRLNQVASKSDAIINIALRINPDVDPNTHEYIATGLRENKFGIALNEINTLCQSIKSLSALRLIGIACHIGSQLTCIKPFLLAIDRMLIVYKALVSTGFEIDFINMGGGLGIIYDRETPPTINAYANAVQEKLAAYPLRLIIEPGRAMVGNAGMLLTSIEYLKHNPRKNFAIVDAGMNDLLRPALYTAWQNILPVIKRKGNVRYYDIVGPICETADFLGKDRKLCIKAGDLLAVDCAGAYGFSMSSNYNSRARAAEVLIDQDKIHLIRKRENVKDLFALEQINNEQVLAMLNRRKR